MSAPREMLVRWLQGNVGAKRRGYTFRIAPEHSELWERELRGIIVRLHTMEECDGSCKLGVGINDAATVHYRITPEGLMVLKLREGFTL